MFLPTLMPYAVHWDTVTSEDYVSHAHTHIPALADLSYWNKIFMPHLDPFFATHGMALSVVVYISLSSRINGLFGIVET